MIRRFWPRVVKWWDQAKGGGAILGHPRAYMLRVFLPSLLSWFASLGVMCVFLHAYNIPISFHTLMRICGGNSIANVTSVTPGGAGVTQAFNVASLNGITSAANATAYSVAQQLVTTAWNIVLAIILMVWAFGWSGGRQPRRGLVHRGEAAGGRPERGAQGEEGSQGGGEGSEESGRLSTYARVSGLPLVVEGYELERLEQAVSSGFTRVSTVVRLRGGGEEGVGEDVTYEAADHDRFQADGLGYPLAGDWTFDSFSQHVGALDLFPGGASREVYRNYRRWGVESAALDLALRQAGLGAAEALGREARPVRFVLSLRLDPEPTAEPVRRRIELYPWVQFKLDATSGWGDAFVEELAALGVVETVDFKGAYRGTAVDTPPDAALYERVAVGLPGALLEDPALTAETDPVLEPYRDRITWDAIIHSVSEIEELPFAPRVLNMKPSRFGSLEALLDAYDYLEERGIAAYGGGQFELGPGRGQIQALASLFHPDGPNDVAPAGFNAPEPGAGLPASPLEPGLSAVGFRRDG